MAGVRTSGILAVVVLSLVAGLAPGREMWPVADTNDMEWFDPNLWGGELPAPSDQVLISSGSMVATADDVLVDDYGSVRFGSVTAAFRELSIGWSGRGYVSVFGGDARVSTVGTFLGVQSWGLGELEIRGTRCLWSVGEEGLVIGERGQGSMRVTEGAVNCLTGILGRQSGSTGAAEIGGNLYAGQWTGEDLIVGEFGTGSLVVRPTGRVRAANMIVGKAGESAGSVVVYGARGTRYSSEVGLEVTDRLTVGHLGSAELTLREEAAVECGTVLVGLQPARADDALGVGGVRRITLREQSYLSADLVSIGCARGAVAEIDVLDDASGLRCGTLNVGADGYGALYVRSGDVYVEDVCSIGHGPGGIGTVALDGSLHVGELYLGAPRDGQDRSGEGELRFLGGRVIVQERLIFGPSGTLAGGGEGYFDLCGASLANWSMGPRQYDALIESKVNFRDFGAEVVTLEVAGRDDGVCVADLGGRFAIGTLSLSGSRSGMVRLVDDFDNTPDSDDPDALYVKHLVLREGVVLDLNGLNLYYEQLTNEGGCIIGAGEFRQIVHGDLDGDSEVDLDDFRILKSNFGLAENAGCSDGDLNGDGVVNLEDFVIFKTAFAAQ